MGYSFSKLFKSRHWYQFADDAAVLTGQEYENQILLNTFKTWCTWCNMKIRVDKCKIFGVAKNWFNGKTNLSKTLNQRGDNNCVKRKRKLRIPWSLLWFRYV